MKNINKNFLSSKEIPIDEFISNVLYDESHGYYSKKIPFGKNGDFITAPEISFLFGEVLAIWVVSFWEHLDKPKNFNIIELGPGNGLLSKILVKTFKKFPEFFDSSKMYLYEKSKKLKEVQKKLLHKEDIKWIQNLNSIKKGPVLFLGNEFFDAIPIKQFKRLKNRLYEKYFIIDKNNKIKEIYKKASKENFKIINSYKSLKKLQFIEFPKFGFDELGKIVKQVIRLKGCILLIDYGYLKSNNQNTLQSVMKHKKNELLNNLGNADITAHVNFTLLNEFFVKNGLKIKNVISQRNFLETMGILERASILAKKMKFTEQTDLYLRIKRLLSPRYMGDLFKVILAYKLDKNKFAGFK